MMKKQKPVIDIKFAPLISEEKVECLPSGEILRGKEVFDYRVNEATKKMVRDIEKSLFNDLVYGKPIKTSHNLG